MSEHSHPSPLSQQCLIFLRFDVVRGIERAQEALKKLAECGEVVNVSSVYKEFSDSQRYDLTAKIIFVVKFQTKLTVDQTHFLLVRTLESLNEKTANSSEGRLLAYGQVAQISPKLTLPAPELSSNPLLIRCAAEVWGEYEHPIYQRCLSELVKDAPSVQSSEFFSQGKTLVAFSR